VLQRAIKPAKELFAQNPSQDDLHTRATSSLVFAKQVAAAGVVGVDRRWQQAGNRSEEAGLVTRQGCKMARNATCVSFVTMVLSHAPQAPGEQSTTSQVCQS